MKNGLCQLVLVVLIQKDVSHQILLVKNGTHCLMKHCYIVIFDEEWLVPILVQTNNECILFGQLMVLEMTHHMV